MFPQVFGKYVLEREIASGGMARVYLATLRGAGGFEKRLVVKQIRPELASDEAFVKRFVEEAKTTVELSHPNIVPVYELGVEQGVYYIAMEFCEGVTLAELLAETGPLSPEEGAYLGVEICRALDYAHRRAIIVHRDVTPRNVIVNDEGGVRLIDFGIAAPASSGDAAASRRTEVFGSPGHMPPEQLEGKLLTPATDVFAVGALLIEAWTGRAPFRRATPEACKAALLQPLPDLSETDPKLSAISEALESSVQLDPALRPESAELLARPLRQFLKSVDLGEIERRLGDRVSRARRRSYARLPARGLVPANSNDALITGAHDSGKTPALPVTPVAEKIVTLTFAARDDMKAWTRKLPSEPPVTGAVEPERVNRGVRTVRIASEPVIAEVEAESPAAAAAEASSVALEAPGRDPEVLPLSSRERGRDARAPGHRFRNAIMAGAAGALLVLVSLQVARRSALSGGTAAKAPAAVAGPKVDVPPKTVVGAVGAAAPASEDRISADAGAAALQLSASAAAPRPAASKRTSSSAETAPLESAPPKERAGVGQLTLSSEPPARVSVAGRVGQTPLVLGNLQPGTYQVVFEEPTLNERLVGTVQLGAGENKRLHADFTGATPTVY